MPVVKKIQKIHQCDKCPMVFNVEKKLSYHKVLHTGAMPYV